MLAGQGKPLAKELSPRARKVKSLAILTLFSASLFAFAFAIAASSTVSGQWHNQQAPANNQLLTGADNSNYVKTLQRYQQQQQQQPLVVDDDDDDSSGRLAYSPPELASQHQQQQQQQTARQVYYDTLQRQQQQQQSVAADQLRREKLARQWQLARQLLAERVGQQHQNQQQQQQQLFGAENYAVDVDDNFSSSSSNNNNNQEDSALPIRVHLVDSVGQASNLLTPAERGQLLNRLAHTIRLGGAGAVADDDAVDLYNQRLTSDYLSSPIKSLAAAPLVASGQEASPEGVADLDRPLFGQNEAQQTSEEPKGQYFYDLQQEEKRDEESSGRQVDKPDDQVEDSSRPAKYTTLLEDEQEEEKNKNESQASDQASTTTTTTTTTNPIEVKVGETRPNKQNDREDEDTRPRAEASTTTYMGSMITRMWNSIASYLPYFSQVGSKKVDNDNKATESSGTTGTNAKHSVSNAVTKQTKDEASVANGTDVNTNTSGSNHIGQGEDKLEKVKTSEKGSIVNNENMNKIQKDASDENSFSSLGTFEGATNNNNNDINRRSAGQQQTLENSKRVHLEANGAINMDSIVQQQQQQQRPSTYTDQNQVSFIRSSNLIMPIGSDDEMVQVRQSSKSPLASDGFVSKYIYAPTHHYYLTPNSKLTPYAMGPSAPVVGQPSELDSSEQPQLMAHRSFQGQQQHQFLPGQHIFGSYDTLKPAYAFQKGGLEGIALVNGNGTNSKSTNDIYFLVMVGAFCVMAMAVVLAAGLFAYRVQQNRKSSQDTDYPTYGVVGPNNMDGKCGAAAFMGGYLGAGGGPGSSGSFGSKSGSSKHLPDMYASDSGLASTDKGSSKKASLASASSATTPQDHHNNNNLHLHQQQQQQQQQQSSSSNRSTPTGNNFVANNQDAARMYHYQHQKQQMIISDRGAPGGRHTSASDLDSEEENEDGSYTVYECPGLASAHEMEIKNPLFNDDQSP